MNCIFRRCLSAVLLTTSVLTVGVSVRAQNSVGAVRPAISVLDSTKEQDGLVGSVRRVKTETAKIELKDGRAVEGPAQLVEVTTYGIKGNRVENTSYPIGNSLVGKEEYKYDERGNITEMTLRDDRDAILSREAYTYEFDKLGNWTRMVTNLVVFENGELKREPTEVTYRTLTYYFDDTVAKVVAEPMKPELVLAPSVPETATEFQAINVLEIVFNDVPRSVDEVGEPPVLMEKIVGTESAFAARKENEADLVSVQLEPSSADVLFNLGRAYLKSDKNLDALKAFQESAKLNPDFAETQYGLGLAHYRIRHFKEAVDAFKKATTLSPNMAKAHYGLSLAYQELGNTSGLLQEHRILERLDRSLARKLEQTYPQYNFSCRLVVGCP